MSWYVHVLASMNNGNGYHCERLYRVPELEENVPVLGFVECSANIDDDDVYIIARAVYDVYDDTCQYGHSWSAGRAFLVTATELN